MYILSIVIPEVTIATIDPAVPGDDVTLNCSATGDTPLTYQWTMEGSDTTININTSTGILTLTNFMEDQFGTYICNVSNVLGSEVNSITVVQASELDNILFKGNINFLYYSQLLSPLPMKLSLLWKEIL